MLQMWMCGTHTMLRMHNRFSHVCCSVLQCVAVCCSVMQRDAVCCSVLQCVAVCCSVLQCVAACCSVLQRVAMCCNLLLLLAVCGRCGFVLHILRGAHTLDFLCLAVRRKHCILLHMRTFGTGEYSRLNFCYL